jgi:hypothetical protein
MMFAATLVLLDSHVTVFAQVPSTTLYAVRCWQICPPLPPPYRYELRAKRCRTAQMYH